jgi:hypothetical protein
VNEPGGTFLSAVGRKLPTAVAVARVGRTLLSVAFDVDVDVDVDLAFDFELRGPQCKHNRGRAALKRRDKQRKHPGFSA